MGQVFLASGSERQAAFHRHDAQLAPDSFVGQSTDLRSDGLRALVLANGVTKFGLGSDLAVPTAVTAVLVSIAARIYPRLTA